MSVATSWDEAAAQLCKDIFDTNVTRLQLGKRTLEKVQAAPPKGQPILLADGTLAMSLGGRVLGAAPDAESVQQTRESIERGHGSVALVFGLGMGNAARELRRAGCARTIIFEPDEGVIRRVLEFGPSELDGIPIYCDMDDLQEDWRRLSGARSTATLVRSPGYADAFPEALKQVEAFVQSALSTASVNENTSKLRSQSWVEYLLQNLPRIVGKRPFLSLRGKYKNVPAFIVGAGPSLNGNIHLVGEAARKGIVFAVNTSARLLARHEVPFQVVASLESKDMSSQMQGIPWMDRAIRAFSLTANPGTWTAGQGPLMPMHEANPAYAAVGELLDVPGIGVSGSVTTAAFSLAEYLGCSPIVFLGQDLAYPEGRIHADGTEAGQSRIAVDHATGMIVYHWSDDARAFDRGNIGLPAEERLLEVEAWGGAGKVVTSSMWNLARDWLEARAREIAQYRPDMKLINATEGGSRIAGFAEERLADVLARLEPLEITPESMAARAGECAPPLDDVKLAAWADGQARRAKDAADAADVLSSRVQEALDAISGAEPGRISKAYERLARAEAKFRAAVAAFPLLDAWCGSEIDAAMEAGASMPGSTERARAARAALETERRIAAAVAAGARDMEPRLLAIGPVSKPHPTRTNIPEARRNSCHS